MNNSCSNESNKHVHNLLNGQWTNSLSKQKIELFSPVDGSLVGSVDAMNTKDVDAAIESSHQARSAWASTPIYKRAEIFYKTAQILIEDAEKIADVMMMEIAKDRKSAIQEILRTADFINYTADVGKSLEGSSVNGDSFPNGSRNKMSYVNRVPLGTVLAISPFNYPINLSASKIAPALIGGNAVVLKPPTQGAISALYLADAFHRAGLPAGVLNTVTGRGSEIGDYLITHPGIDFINFTGSSEVGKHVASIAKMVPLVLELGGKDAAIILEDADLDFAADNIVSGAFSYSGQRCTAVKRILVLDSVADQLVEKCVSRIEKLKIGNPWVEGVSIIPLINQAAADSVQNLIDEAIKLGAHVAIGNHAVNNLMSPTLLDHVTTDMKIAWVEPFGPVLPVLRVHSIEEAINIANHSEYGLQSSIFTHNINHAFNIANKLEVGTVQINNKTERGPDNFPFSGIKASGMGTQGVRYSIEAMTRLKSIVVNIEEN